MFVGIDVGGANTKIATSEGFVESVYAPLWRNKAVLHDVLAKAKQKFEPEIEAVGVVMTGELCDCFVSKREGVLHIKNALASSFDDPKFLDRNCMFRVGSAVDKDPLAFASTNWLASAKLVSDQYGDAIFIDIGSTTTDVIPIVAGELKANRRDLERLKSHELIYSGVVRTNVAALLNKVKIGGDEYRTSSELFALTADAYLVLGCLTADDYSCESPDSYAFANRDTAEKSRLSAMRRLARVVCSDLEELGEEGTVRIAEQVKRAQVEELSAAMAEMKARYGLQIAVSTGVGEFIAKEAAEALNMQFISLSARYGRTISAAFPAYAVAKLLERSL